jgi:hypothetical protein
LVTIHIRILVVLESYLGQLLNTQHHKTQRNCRHPILAYGFITIFSVHSTVLSLGSYHDLNLGNPVNRHKKNMRLHISWGKLPKSQKILRAVF